MKQVRYLAGAVGLTPMVLGAVAGGGAHAAADVTGHHKTVAPYAWARQRQIPDITTVHCSSHGDIKGYVEVFNSARSSPQHCFSQTGAEPFNIQHFDSLYTGKYRVRISLNYLGRSYTCTQSLRSATLFPCAGVPWNQGRVTYIDVF